ncbi:hypothetical protein OE88DRAFT_1659163 [Heliocybe sulcata]|uniref:Uncharacterized protein n=1 Tax=Heliocybe sulcata TaxID=5364 RepID=A0A5C3N2M0_9AGAM|nr:hypothetical protein OE88DRAFT_1659163 [Heliocybe sulcata]
MPCRPYPRLKSGKFECDWDGLTVKGHSLADEWTIKYHLGMIVNHTPRGNISKRQPSERDLKKPKAWWEAQMVFYNLKKGSSISAMQDILRTAIATRALSVPESTRALEAKLKQEYIELSKKAADDNWSACTTDEERVNLDPERFLRETFDRKKAPPVDLYVIKGRQYLDRFGVHQAAEKLTLQTQSADAYDEEGKVWTRWVIVGRDSAQVYEHATWIEAEGRRRSYEKMEAQLKALKKQKAKRSGRDRDSDEENWEGRLSKRARPISTGDSDNEDSEEDHRTEEDDDEHSVSQSPEQRSDSDETSHSDLEDQEDDEEQEGDEPEYERDPKLKPVIARFRNALDVTGEWNMTAPGIASMWPHVSENMHLTIAMNKTKKGEQLFAQFNLGVVEGVMAFDTPPVPPTFESTFLWRGRENGEGKMRFSSYCCGKVTFEKETMTLKGVIAGACGTWKFSGERLAKSSLSGTALKDEYEGYNMEAYEREAEERWR